MKNLKKATIFVLAILMCLALFACGSEEKDKKIEEIEGDPNCAHEWSAEANSTKKPCTRENTVYHTCNLCGRLEILKTLPPQGHSYTEDRKSCSVCNKKAVFGCLHGTCEWTVIISPDCTNAGYQNSICQKCLFIQDVDTLSALGHSFINHDYKDPTCTEIGNKAYSDCTVCDYTTYEMIPALGHTFIAGTCRVCEEKDDRFTLLENPHLAIKELEIKTTEPTSTDGKAAVITQHNGNIAYENQQDSYQFTAKTSGNVRVWLTEVYNGTYFNLSAKNHLNEGDTHYSMSNGQGFTFISTAGETYTINVKQHTSTGTYTLNIAEAKDTVDLSEYTVINDSIEFEDQKVIYSYTPKVSGNYRFELSEVMADCRVDIYITNKLGEKIRSNSYCGNNDGVTAIFEANETYNITVGQNNNFSKYTMTIGVPHEVTDITEYNSIKDKMVFVEQANLYSFTPKTTGQYNFMLSELNKNTVVYLILYNDLGEKLTADSYAQNEDSISYELTAGETYSVAVKYYTGSSDYVLVVTPARESLALSSNNGYKDRFNYKNQTITYTFTPSNTDTHIFAISDLSDENSYARITIENAEGEKIVNKQTLNKNEQARVLGLSADTEYNVILTLNGNPTDFTFSVQSIASEN